MSKRRFLYSLLIILLLIVAGAGWLATDYLGNQERQEIIGESRGDALTLSIHVSDTLNHFEGTVKSLAGAVWIAPALMSMEDQDIERANSTLDRYNSAMNASVTYLMDVDGMTVASSNRKDADSFVGKSYRFRPYFQKAAQGRSSHYFALGITSGKLGFYASYPVQNRLGKVLGVVTMKKDLDAMETFFSRYPFCFLISPDGIIILSNTPAMILKSFWPLDKTTYEKLIASQQFGNKLSEAAFLKKEVADGTEVTLDGNDYLVSRKVIDSDGWSIALLTPTDRVWIYKLIGILATMGACSLIIFFSGIIYVRDRSQKAIRQSEESKRLLLHAAGEGIFGVDATGQMTFVNPAALRMLGFAEEEMLGQRVHALIHHSHKDGSNYSVEDCPIYTSYTKATKSHVTDDVLWRKDGSSFPTEYNSTPFVRDGRVMGAVVTFKDITARKQVEEALHRSEMKFRTLYDSTSDAVMLLDKNGFFDCNKAALAIFGCATQKEFCMKHPADLSPPEQPGGADSMVLANQMIATAMEKGSIHFEWMHKRNDTGATFPADVLLTAMELDGKPVVQAVVRDITKRKRSEEKMEFFAAHDVLTGLLNRRSLEEMLNRTIAKAKRGTFSSLLYMDLDNFKDVNDTVGHAAGDDVLITLAGLFKDAVRTEDIVFRLGGDEFGVLLDGIDGREALSAAERLRSVVEAYSFEQESRVFPLSLSIGLIEIDGTRATGELMSQADVAMYRAKAQGKNRVVVAYPVIPAVVDMMEAIESH